MKNEKYEIIVSERALTMLRNHVAFVAKVSNSAATKLKREILTEIREIDNMPEKYPWLINEYLPINKYHKKIVDKRYIIIYQIKGTKIHVDYIIDGRQDYDWLLT